MKKTSTSLALLALASLISAPSAHAGIFDFDPAESSAYVSGFVGIAFQSDADFDGVQAPAEGVPGAVGAPAEIQADFDNDIYFGGAVGYRLPFKYWKYFQPRLEAEISHYDSDVSSGTFNDGSQTFSGSQSATYFLINNASGVIIRGLFHISAGVSVLLILIQTFNIFRIMGNLRRLTLRFKIAIQGLQQSPLWARR